MTSFATLRKKVVIRLKNGKFTITFDLLISKQKKKNILLNLIYISGGNEVKIVKIKLTIISL